MSKIDQTVTMIAGFNHGIGDAIARAFAKD